MLWFRDSEMVEWTPNKIFPLVITIKTGQFNVSQTLFDDSSSCNIKYLELNTTKISFSFGCKMCFTKTIEAM